MKIVCMYGDNPLASWMLSRGLPSVMRRMGHEVIEIPTLGTSKVTRADVERINKPITPDVDLVFVSGPEYLMSWIKTFYPAWQDLKMPKACWYHESETRDDRVADFSAIAPWFDLNFMPNESDAERHGAIHLPVGVDTKMFHVEHSPWELRTIELAFIGTLYDKREKFLRALVPHLGKSKLIVGHALVQDIEGINLEKSVNLLSSEYRRIKILLNLPTLSSVLVSKVLEASACGCLVLTPEPRYCLVGAGYMPDPEHLGGLIRYYSENPKWAAEKAKSDCEYTHAVHRMELRLEKVFASMGVAV